MASVDNRVVQMTFDNARFEQNAKTTQETLKRLDESLAFKNGARGLTDLEVAGRNFTMGGMGSIVDGISGKFNAMGIAATTALMNITNRAIDAGISLVKSLTIDPISTGLNEYETKINAIQTILTNTASKGTTLEDVNFALAELNEYADKTIYNFAEMARNIGTFTAAGVELEPATNAIKGIANLAAGSGSTAQQASTAMYQLSQALAEGRVSLQTWNSVVNAGMGGELFQRALVEEAVVLGDLTQQAADSILSGELSFRQAIMSVAGKGPMLDISTQNLINVFNKFAEDPALVKAATRVRTFTMLLDTMQESVQSGWAQSWELIIGDMEESATLLTEINDAFGEIVGKQVEARNELLKGWKILGGRDDLIQAFRNIGSAIMSIVEPISEAFSSIFAPMIAFDLANITDQFKRFTEGLILSEETMNNLKRTFQGVFAIFDIIGKAVGFVIDVFSVLIGAIFPSLGDGFLGITANIGDFFTGLNEAIESSEFFQKALEKIQSFIQDASTNIPEFFKSTVSAIEGFTGISFQEINDKLYAIRMEIQEGIISGELLSSGWENVSSTFTKVGEGIKKTWEVMKNIFNQVKEFLAPFITPMVDFIKGAANSIKEAFHTMIDTGDWTPLFSAIETGFFGALVLGIRKFLKSITGVVDEASGFAEGLGKVLGGVTNVLNNFSASVQADALKKVATAIAILTVSLLVLSFIDSEKLAGALTAITALFLELVGTFASLQKTGILASAGGMSLAGSMIGFSIAIGILAGALAKISDSDPDRMLSSVIILGLIMGELSLVAKSLTRVSGMFGMGQLILISASVYILADVVEKLALLDVDKALQGVIGVGALLGELALFTNFSKKMNPLEGFGFIGLAVGITILTGVITKLAALDLETLAIGTGAIAILLAVLGGFSRLSSSKTDMINVGVGISLIAISMNILTKAIRDIGEIPLEQVAIGLGSIVVSLAAFVGASRLMPKDGIGALANSGAIAIMASSMIALGLALKIMSTIPLAGMGIALGGLAVSLGIMVGAAKLLGPAAPTLLNLAGAVALLGLGLGLTGAGILAFSAGVGALAVVGAGGLAAFSLAIRTFLDTIPYAMQKIGEGLAAFAQVVIDNAPLFAEAFIVLIREGLRSLHAIIPDLVQTLFEILNEVLDTLIEQALPLADKLFDLVIMLLGVLTERVPELVQVVLNLFSSIFNEVGNKLAEFGINNLSGILSAMEQLGLVFVAFVGAGFLAKKATQGAIAVGITLGSIVGALFLLNMLPADKTIAMIDSLTLIIVGLSVTLSLLGNLNPSAGVSAALAIGSFIGVFTGILATLGGIKQIPGIDWIIEEGAEFLEAIGNALGRMIGAIGGGIAEGFTNSLPKVADNMSTFASNLEPFIESIGKIKKHHIDSAISLAGLIVAFAAAEVLDAISGWIAGDSSIVKFGEELEALAPHLVKFAEAVAPIGDSKVSAAVNAAKQIMEMASMVPNSGGVAGWWFGENSLTAFGEELSEFAPSLKKFANDTKGINKSTVNGPVAAAKAIMEMASFVPNSGGVTGWWFGENNLSSFAIELEGFGSSIANFASETKGVTLGSVSGPVAAAKAIMEMATLAPNQGGVTGWWFGENSLSVFATNLIPFGEAMSSFSAIGGTINPENIGKATAGAKKLVDLANLIPNQGGVAGWWFGDNTLADLGSDLSTLAEALVTFSKAAKDIDGPSIQSAIDQITQVIDMAIRLKEMEGIDSNAFKDLLSSLAASGISGFTQTFSNSKEEVRTSILIMLDAAKLAIEEKIMEFGAAGMRLINLGFKAGVDQAVPAAKESVTLLFESIIETPTQAAPLLKQATNILINNSIVAVFKERSKEIIDTFAKIISDMETIIKNSYSRFRQAGNQIALGLKNGILDKAREIAQAAAQVVRDALNAVNDAADVRSPSRETYWSGQMIAQGLLDGITDSSNRVRSTARDFASYTINAINESLSDTPQLTITPVLDMSEFNIQKDILKNDIISTDNTSLIAAKAMSVPSSVVSATNQNGSGLFSGITFQQNNYSPRALTRAEIYRQTSNLLATAKGAVTIQ